MTLKTGNNYMIKHSPSSPFKVCTMLEKLDTGILFVDIEGKFVYTFEQLKKIKSENRIEEIA